MLEDVYSLHIFLDFNYYVTLLLVNFFRERCAFQSPDLDTRTRFKRFEKSFSFNLYPHSSWCNNRLA